MDMEQLEHNYQHAHDRDLEGSPLPHAPCVQLILHAFPSPVVPRTALTEERAAGIEQDSLVPKSAPVAAFFSLLDPRQAALEAA
jgi:hypothetical protein